MTKKNRQQQNQSKSNLTERQKQILRLRSLSRPYFPRHAGAGEDKLHDTEKKAMEVRAEIKSKNLTTEDAEENTKATGNRQQAIAKTNSRFLPLRGSE